jgi:hypothetical protein
MNIRLFLQTASNICYIILGFVLGEIAFERFLPSLPHNVTHFITFWCVFATIWVSFFVIAKFRKIYKISLILEDSISLWTRDVVSLILWGALLWLSGKLLFIVFFV